ncbi:hypothetical protein ANO11243_031890 [Dothideomycetidae sp. 11243]|nr:hypothetical protein ANO11243_031890 [fungal sp. No.11243]
MAASKAAGRTLSHPRYGQSPAEPGRLPKLPTEMNSVFRDEEVDWEALYRKRIHEGAEHGGSPMNGHTKLPQSVVASHSLRSIRSTLPPTPPQQTGEAENTPLLSPSALSDIYHTAVTSPAWGISTPVHLTSPPTPDNTPPSRRERLMVPRNNLIHFPSLSQADSFVTARETMNSQSSSRSQALTAAKEEGSAARPSFTRISHSNVKNAVVPDESLKSQTNENAEAHTSQFLEESQMTSRLTVSQEQDLSKVIGQSFASDEHTQATSAVDTGRRQIPTNATSVDSGSSNAASPPRKPRHRQRATDATMPSPSASRSSEQIARNVADTHDVLYVQLRDEKSKRLSAHSTSSTIVEALVYSSPDKPRRCLRHAGRNMALRDDIHFGSRRSSSDSYESAHQGRLRHHISPLPGRGFGAGRLGTTIKPRAVSSPEKLQALAWDGPVGADNTSTVFALRSLTRPAKRLSHGGPRPAMPELEHLNLAGSPSEDAEDDIDMHYGFKTGNSFNQQALSKASNTGTSAVRLLEDPSLLSNTAIDNHGDFHRRTDSVQAEDIKLNGQRHRRGSDNFVRAPRASPEQAQGSSARRASLDPRTENASARHHLSVHTPLSEWSQWSDRTHNAEVNTATAVSIHPHHNESLLLIQQLNHNNFVQAKHDRRYSSPDPLPREHNQTDRHPRFEAFVHESTPPPAQRQELQPYGVDSPLLNPRAAPEPPVIKFIPPTPNDDEDRRLGHDSDETQPFSMNTTEALPVRRPSLREKAIAHSSAILDAIMLRHPSIRSQQRNDMSDMPDETRRRNLHPFWRPRGFWDDFDSDDEDYEDEPLDPDTVEPLPRGGDTSEVAEFPRKMSKRLPGFRGTGGFLIGNSLGIGRHGTNNRRPYVSMPLRSRPSQSHGHSASLQRNPTLTRGGGVSRESLIRANRGVAKNYRVPGLEVVKLHALKGIRETIRDARRARAERAAEKRRQYLRSMIGVRIVHNN